MELKEQRYVVTLADTGNLTKAASILNISQPALSLYIKNLETEYGEDLFARENRRLKPTYFGEMFIEKSRQILKIGDDFKNELSTIKNGSRGRVVVGIPAWKTATLLPKTLNIFKDTYHDIEIDLVENTEDKLCDLLKQGRIDFYIGASQMDDTKMENIKKEKLYFIANEKASISQKVNEGNKSLKISDINGENFILLASDIKANTLPFNLEESKLFKPTRVSYINTFDTIIELLKNNLGVSIIPESLLNKYNLDGLKVIEIESKDFNIDTNIIKLSKTKQNPFALVLSEMIKENI